MTTTTNEPVVDTFKDKLGNARKAIGAGVTAGLAAATPLFISAIQIGSDGGATVTGNEIGAIGGGFVAALLSVGYVTWQTANKPKPTDVAKIEKAIDAAAIASAPITVAVTETATTDNVDAVKAAIEGDAGLFEETDETPVVEGYEPKHSV